MAGGGLSGQLALEPLHPSSASTSQQGSLQDLAVGPGVAPWAAGRVGLIGSNEAGLTYAGRDVRADVRHAFTIGRLAALSVGLGASVVMAQRPSDATNTAVYGGGLDIPVLIGVRNSSDNYAFWFGPRGGFEILRGDVPLDPNIFDVQVTHFYAGLTAGMRVGFRHVHLALELNASYHSANGAFTTVCSTGGPPLSTTPCSPVVPSPPPTSTSVQQLSLTPAGAIEITF
jgi:hypothetical protein